MKKTAGRKRPIAAPNIKANLTDMLAKVQQQLLSLEKKIDTLIYGLPRASETKGASWPSQLFDRSGRQPSFAHEKRIPERTMYKAICADCSNECEVPFRPSQDRPVYCKECYAKRRNNRPHGQHRHDNRPKEVAALQAQAGHSGKSERTGRSRKQAPRRLKQKRR